MIDRTNPIPMYLQVKNELEKMIKSGELKPGDRIYSESELCEKCKPDYGEEISG